MRSPSALFLKTLWIWPVAALVLILACEGPSDAVPAVPADDAADADGALQVAAAAEARSGLDADLADARLRLAERDEWVAEQERLLEERRALVLKQEELSGRLAELERREEAVAEEALELEIRERSIESVENELRSTQDEVRESRVAAVEEVPPAVVVEAPPVVRVVETSLPVGTVLDVELLETVTSRTALPGDRFVTRVARDIYSEEGLLAVPQGSELLGVVTKAKRLRRVGGQAQLGIEMDSLILPSGDSRGVHASLYEVGVNQKNDKKKIFAAAAAGALLGRILGDKGGGSSTALGAALGAAAGTAVVATRKGHDVELERGQIIAVRLDEIVTVETELVGVAGD